MNIEKRAVKLDSAELRRWLRLYDLEGYLFEEVRRRFEAEQTLRPYDFFAIVIWKSNRAKTKIKGGLAEAGKTVEALMKEVSEAATPLAKVEVLLQIWGIGLAMASAILTVCCPEEFTVLDYRAWKTLQQASVDGLPERYPQSPEAYLAYCRACKELADRMGLSLRDLDRALWAKNWEDDLLELIPG
jgi:thermostable 8-oxoguanine DNA glycosylase